MQVRACEFIRCVVVVGLMTQPPRPRVPGPEMICLAAALALALAAAPAAAPAYGQAALQAGDIEETVSGTRFFGINFSDHITHADPSSLDVDFWFTGPGMDALGITVSGNAAANSPSPFYAPGTSRTFGVTDPAQLVVFESSSNSARTIPGYYRVSDGTDEAFAKIKIEFPVAPGGPSASPILLEIEQGSEYEIDFGAATADPDDPDSELDFAVSIIPGSTIVLGAAPDSGRLDVFGEGGTASFRSFDPAGKTVHRILPYYVTDPDGNSAQSHVSMLTVPAALALQAGAITVGGAHPGPFEVGFGDHITGGAELRAITLDFGGTDPESEGLDISGVQLVGGRHIVTSSDHSITIHSARNEARTVQFSYAVADAAGGSASGTVSAAITAAPALPVSLSRSHPGTFTVPFDRYVEPEGAPHAVSFSFGSGDAESNGLRVSGATLDSGTYTVASPDRTVSFETVSGAERTVPLSYTADYGGGRTLSGTVSLEVTSSPSAPHAASAVIAAMRDAPVVVDFGDLVTDADTPIWEQEISFASVRRVLAQSGTIHSVVHSVVSPDRTVTLVGRSADIYYVVTDPTGLSSGGRISMLESAGVVPGMGMPAASEISYSVLAGGSFGLDFGGHAADPESGIRDLAVSFRFDDGRTAESNGFDIRGATLQSGRYVVDAQDRSITVTETAGTARTARLSYTVADPGGQEASAPLTISVAAASAAPDAGSGFYRLQSAHSSPTLVDFGGMVSDADTDISLQGIEFSFSRQPPFGLRVFGATESGGTYTVNTPDGAVLLYYEGEAAPLTRMPYTVTDPQGQSDSASPTVRFSSPSSFQAPTARPISQSRDHPGPFEVDFGRHTSDPNHHDALLEYEFWFESGDAGSNGLQVSGAVPDSGRYAVSPDGRATFTSTDQTARTISLQYEARDPTRLVSQSTITLAVGGAATAPSARDTTVSFAHPGPSTVGFDYLVDDSSTAISDQTVTFSFRGGTAIQHGLEVRGAALSGGTYTVDSADGAIMLRSVAGHARTIQLDYAVADPGGLSDSGTITLEISGMSRGIYAAPAHESGAHPGPLTVEFDSHISTSVQYPPELDGEAAGRVTSFWFAQGTAESNGMRVTGASAHGGYYVVDSRTRATTFESTENSERTVPIHYAAGDLNPARAQSVGTILLEVSAASVPTATPLEATGVHPGPIELRFADSITDPDTTIDNMLVTFALAGTLAELGLEIASGASELAGGTFNVTSDDRAVGLRSTLSDERTITGTFTATNRGGLESSSDITITVLDPRTAPSAPDIELDTPHTEPITLAFGNHVTDTNTHLSDQRITLQFPGGTPESSGLDITDLKIESGAYVVDNREKSITIRSTINDDRTAEFTYTVTDPGGQDDTGTVEIAVTAVHVAPTAREIRLSGGHPETFDIDFGGYVTDPDTDIGAQVITFRFGQGTESSHGLDIDGASPSAGVYTVGTTDAGKRAITIQTTRGGDRTVTLNYDVTDPQGGRDESDIVLRITPDSGSPPVASDVSAAANVPERLVLRFADSISDPDMPNNDDGLAVTFTLEDNPLLPRNLELVSGADERPDGSFRVTSADFAVTFRSTGGDDRTILGSYTVRDLEGNPASAGIRLVVNEPSRAPVASPVSLVTAHPDEFSINFADYVMDTNDEISDIAVRVTLFGYGDAALELVSGATPGEEPGAFRVDTPERTLVLRSTEDRARSIEGVYAASDTDSTSTADIAIRVVGMSRLEPISLSKVYAEQFEIDFGAHIDDERETSVHGITFEFDEGTAESNGLRLVSGADLSGGTYAVTSEDAVVAFANIENTDRTITLEYDVTNPDMVVSSSTVTLESARNPLAPLASPVAVFGTHPGPFEVQFSGAVSDPDDEPGEIGITMTFDGGAGSNGLRLVSGATQNADGSFALGSAEGTAVFESTQNSARTVRAAYTATDPGGLPAYSTVLFGIVADPVAPVANPISRQGANPGPFRVSFADHVEDPDTHISEQTITFSFRDGTASSHGMRVSGAALSGGTYTAGGQAKQVDFASLINDDYTVTLDYMVRDPDGLESSSTIEIMVQANPDGPEALPVSASITHPGPEIVEFGTMISDPNSPAADLAVTFELADLERNGLNIVSGAALSGGTYTVIGTAKLSAIGSTEDTDRTARMPYVVTDPGGIPDTGELTLHVSAEPKPPAALPIELDIIHGTNQVIRFAAYVQDPDTALSDLAITLRFAEGDAAMHGLSLGNTDLEGVTYTPDNSDQIILISSTRPGERSATLNYRVSDGGRTADSTITLNVVRSVAQATTMPIDLVWAHPGPIQIDFGDYVSDPDTDLSDLQVWFTHTRAQIEAQGLRATGLTYQSDLSFVGTADRTMAFESTRAEGREVSIPYRATDGHGASDSQLDMRILVPPQAAPISAELEHPATFTVDFGAHITDPDTDIAEQDIAFSLASGTLESNMLELVSGAAQNADGSFDVGKPGQAVTFRSAANSDRAVRLDYTVSDTNLAGSELVLESSSTAAIQISQNRGTPQASDISASGRHPGPYTLDFGSGITDRDHAAGQITVEFEFAEGDAESNGVTVTGATESGGTYTVDTFDRTVVLRSTDDSGRDIRLGYDATDPDGHTGSAQAMISITPPLRAPVAQDVVVPAVYPEDVVIGFGDVITDADHGIGELDVTFRLASGTEESNGVGITGVGESGGTYTVETSNRRIEITNGLNEARSLVLEYDVSDPTMLTSSGRVTVNLGYNPDGPIADDIGFEAVYPDSITVDFGEYTSDADHTTEELEIEFLFESGTAESNGLGITGAALESGAWRVTDAGRSVTFANLQDLARTVTLTYTVTDPEGLEAGGTVTLGYVAFSSVPSARPLIVSAVHPGPFELDFASVITDHDTEFGDLSVVFGFDQGVDALGLELVSGADRPGGSFAVNPSLGTAVFASTSEAIRTLTGEYHVSDGTNGASGQLTVRVIDVPDAMPVRLVGGQDAEFDLGFGNHIVDEDTDIGMQSITIRFPGGAAGSHGIDVSGAVLGTESYDVITMDRAITLASTRGPDRTIVADYTARDQDGEESSSTVTLIISDAPLRPTARPVSESTTHPFPIVVSFGEYVSDDDTHISDQAITFKFDSGDAASNFLDVFAATKSGSTYTAVHPSRNVTFQSLENSNRTIGLSYNVTDPDGLAASSTIELDVMSGQFAPVAESDSIRVVYPGTTAIDFAELVTDMDTDISGQVIFFSFVGGSAEFHSLDIDGAPEFAGRHRVITEDRTITIEPTQGGFRNIIMPYTATDVNGRTSSAVITLRIYDTTIEPVCSLDTPASVEFGALADGDLGPEREITVRNDGNMPGTAMVSSGEWLDSGGAAQMAAGQTRHASEPGVPYGSKAQLGSQPATLYELLPSGQASLYLELLVGLYDPDYFGDLRQAIDVSVSC